MGVGGRRRGGRRGHRRHRHHHHHGAHHRPRLHLHHRHRNHHHNHIRHRHGARTGGATAMTLSNSSGTSGLVIFIFSIMFVGGIGMLAGGAAAGITGLIVFGIMLVLTPFFLCIGMTCYTRHRSSYGIQDGIQGGQQGIQVVSGPPPPPQGLDGSNPTLASAPPSYISGAHPGTDFPTVIPMPHQEGQQGFPHYEAPPSYDDVVKDMYPETSPGAPAVYGSFHPLGGHSSEPASNADQTVLNINQETSPPSEPNDVQIDGSTSNGALPV